MNRHSPFHSFHITISITYLYHFSSFLSNCLSLFLVTCQSAQNYLHLTLFLYLQFFSACLVLWSIIQLYIYNYLLSAITKQKQHINTSTNNCLELNIISIDSISSTMKLCWNQNHYRYLYESFLKQKKKFER